MIDNNRLRKLTEGLNNISVNIFAKSDFFLPPPTAPEDILRLSKQLLLPQIYPIEKGMEDSLGVAEQLCILIYDYCRNYLSESESWRMAYEILEQLPDVKATLISDALSIFEGDPAASSVEEIMLCYPGFFAVTAHRIAHLLYKRSIPYLPRMISEYAHKMTGIDIHPGAEIGDGLCIDHGTGIVVGETAVIGNKVKIYQGVTIGAKSISQGSRGRVGGKRHPTIGNRCIIYAGATILGGDTVIGDGSVIGGNVWLTHSVEPGSMIYYNDGGRTGVNKK